MMHLCITLGTYWMPLAPHVCMGPPLVTRAWPIAQLPDCPDADCHDCENSR